MNILYIASVCSNNKFNQLFNNAKVKPAQQAQKYHRLLIEGLINNEKTSVEVLSALSVNRSMSSKIYYKSELEEVNGIKYNYLPFINWPILRHIVLFCTCFYNALKWGIRNKDGLIICDVLDITISGAALLATKILGINNIGIVTDVPSFLAIMSKQRINIRQKIITTINTVIMNNFNSYVFLTEYMNKLINKNHKPYIVIEGQVDVNMVNIANKLKEKYKKKVCLYAGAIHRIYGIEMLTRAFIAANIDDAELHIYGSGDFEGQLKEVCKEYTAIKYFGTVPNDMVVKEQLKATLLINPRPTTEKYTKYSFPSKNMEYMVSGTPMLTTKLPGMPKDYINYAFIIENETIDGFAKKLKEVLAMEEKKLHQLGLKTKKFVLDNKNNVIQAKKILTLVK